MGFWYILYVKHHSPSVFVMGVELVAVQERPVLGFADEVTQAREGDVSRYNGDIFAAISLKPNPVTAVALGETTFLLRRRVQI